MPTGVCAWHLLEEWGPAKWVACHVQEDLQQIGERTPNLCSLGKGGGRGGSGTELRVITLRFSLYSYLDCTNNHSGVLPSSKTRPDNSQTQLPPAFKSRSPVTYVYLLLSSSV